VISTAVEEEVANELTVFPNPAMPGEIIKVNIPYTELRLLNALGQIINSSEQLPEAISPGLYQLQVQSASGWQNTPLLVR